jgi:catechol 2,3-dioxygenase-like lactoylglutathione lyase family enzyme
LSLLKITPELYCEDLDITKKFYTEVFGFTIKYERPKEQFIYFSLDGVDIMVECVYGTGRRWLSGKLERPFGRGINFQWDVAEIDKMYARVESLASQLIFLELETVKYKCDNEVVIQKQFIVQDPDGYLFRFCHEE